MSTSSDEDSDDSDSVNTFDAIERHIASEAEEQAHVQRLKDAERLFDQQTQLLCQCHIRQFYRLDMAMQHISDPRRRFMVVFARSRPKAKETRIIYTKQYLVGMLSNFFRYAILASNSIVGVTLDEVIRSEDPMAMYFDIEIKQKEILGGFADPITVLREHCEANGLPLTQSEIEAIGGGFREAAILPFTEAECQVGMEVMITYLRDMLRQLVGPFPCGFSVLTGCRRTKFSIHVVCTHLYCDGSYLSAPLLAFELARRFAGWVLGSLVPAGLVEHSYERQFKLRALMIDEWSKGTEVVVGEDISHRQIFKGFDDTPIDEGVYSRNHLMRAAGATKGDGIAPALVPVVPGVPMIGDEKSFDKVFPLSQEGQNQWEAHLITRPYHPLYADVVVAGWTPTCWYPQRRGWFANSVAFPRFHSDLASSFSSVVGDCLLPRYIEQRYTGRDNGPLDPTDMNRALTATSAGYERVPKEPIDADDVFMSEDGTCKAFKFFQPNDFIRHDHGSGPERNASAKVFPGGFRCFVCQVSYGIVEESTKEAPFHCHDRKTYTTDDSLAHIPKMHSDSNWDSDGLNWEQAIQKKWFVVEAPMGAGKTEQLCDFMIRIALPRQWKVLVVSFRQFLAAQQSVRLGTYCYLGLTQAKLQESPDPLTICLNSLWKLGHGTYDAIILDEAGLIRRHFLSSTVTNVLLKVYEKFCKLVRAAGFVVMLQDALSQEDVQFFMEIDGDSFLDAQQISAYKMVKPVKIHPINWTTNCFQAFSKMVECYRAAFDDTSCRQPFMVFCSQCNFAEYIVEYLRAIAPTVTGAQPERIKGIWAALKNNNDAFCKRFVEDTCEAATECDVLVCTSVIGAGFSVSRHFPSFHAFLFNNILEHKEEQQFIQRLRMKLDETLMEGISRDSYMFVEKGHGVSHAAHVNIIRADFNTVRVLMVRDDNSATSVSGVVAIENTQARLEAERAISRAKHDTLWIEWSLSVDSPFEPFPEGTEDELREWEKLKVEFMERNNHKRTDIADLLRHEYAEMGISDYIASIEIEPGMNLFRVLATQDQLETMEKAFCNPKLATQLVKLKCSTKEEQDKILGKKSKLKQITVAGASLAQWISWVYKDITPERTVSFFNHFKNKSYSTHFLRSYSFYQLATHILQPMFSNLGASQPFLLRPGTTPFFNGLQFILHPSLGEELERRLESEHTDDDTEKQFRKELRTFVRTFTGNHNARDDYLKTLYKEPTEVRSLIKRVFKFMGLVIKNPNNKRYTIGRETFYVYETTNPSTDFALMLAGKYTRVNILPLLSRLRYSDNLSGPDKEWVDDGLELYNQCAVAVGANVITMARPTDMTGFAVIPRRLQELEIERANGGYEQPTTAEEMQMTVAARHRIEILRRRLAREEADFLSHQHIRDFTVTDNVVVDDEEELTMSCSGEEEHSQDESNPFVLTEAEA